MLLYGRVIPLSSGDSLILFLSFVFSLAPEVWALDFTANKMLYFRCKKRFLNIIVKWCWSPIYMTSDLSSLCFVWLQNIDLFRVETASVIVTTSLSGLLYFNLSSWWILTLQCITWIILTRTLLLMLISWNVLWFSSQKFFNLSAKHSFITLDEKFSEILFHFF